MRCQTAGFGENTPPTYINESFMNRDDEYRGADAVEKAFGYEKDRPGRLRLGDLLRG